MDSDGTCENSPVSASKKWLTLAALSCNWQLGDALGWSRKLRQFLIIGVAACVREPLGDTLGRSRKLRQFLIIGVA